MEITQGYHPFIISLCIVPLEKAALNDSSDHDSINCCIYELVMRVVQTGHALNAGSAVHAFLFESRTSK